MRLAQRLAKGLHSHPQVAPSALHLEGDSTSRLDEGEIKARLDEAGISPRACARPLHAHIPRSSHISAHLTSRAHLAHISRARAHLAVRCAVASLAQPPSRPASRADCAHGPQSFSLLWGDSIGTLFDW